MFETSRHVSLRLSESLNIAHAACNKIPGSARVAIMLGREGRFIAFLMLLGKRNVSIGALISED